MKPMREPLEPVLIMLCGMVVFFVMILFAAENFFGQDAQLFQVVANLLSGFGGALLMRVKPKAEDAAQSKEEPMPGGDQEKINQIA